MPLPLFKKLLAMYLSAAYNVVAIFCEGGPSMCTQLSELVLGGSAMSAT